MSDGRELTPMRLIRSENTLERWPDDVTALVEGAAMDGFKITRSEAAMAWESHSETYAAGWLGVDISDPLSSWRDIKHYFEEEER